MKDMQNNPLLITGVVAVVVGGAAFFGGTKYQQSQTGGASGPGQYRVGPNGQMMGGRNGIGTGAGTGMNARAGMRPVNGEIIAQDDKSITVKLPDGSSKIVILSATTSINKATAGAKTDLATGTKVTAFGTDNSDGSITAQTITIGDLGMFRGATPSAGMK